MLRSIYAMKLSSVFLIMFTLTVGFACAGVLTRRKRLWKAANILLAFVSLSAILYITVFCRSPGSYGVDPMPFSSLFKAKYQPEVYRALVMNIFLFFPFGLGFSVLLPEKCPLALGILITAAAGFLVSFGVEFLQYKYALGMAEADDVICNTLGALIGSLTLVVRRILD